MEYIEHDIFFSMSKQAIQCCFLNRKHRYIFECLLENQERTSALCRHLFPMTQTALLGSHFFAEKRDRYEQVPYLAKYFLSKDQKKVFVDLHVVFKKLLQKVLLGNCPGVSDVRLLPHFQLSPIIGPQDCKVEFINHLGQSTMMIVQPVFHTNEKGQGVFPQENSPWALDFLIDAIGHRHNGHQSIVIYLSLYSDPQSLEITSQIDPEYTRLLEEARKVGVQITSAQTLLDEHGHVSVSFHQEAAFEGRQQKH